MTDKQFHSSKQTNVPEQAAREAERLKNQAKSAMDSASQQAREQGRHTAQQAKDRVGQEADKLANAERAAAKQLRQDDLPTLANYAEQVADGINRFAEKVRHKKVDEIVADVSEFGRKNPALFIAGSVALGAALMRFAKSSDHRDHEEPDRAEPARTFAEQSSSFAETEVHSAVDARTISPQPNGATTSAKSARPSVERPASSTAPGSSAPGSRTPQF